MREDQIQRYARHILLPDIGGVGQQRLLDSTVLIRIGEDRGAATVLIGYLAAAGVGHIAVAGRTDNPIDAHELCTGLIFQSTDLGRPYLRATAERVQALNPDVSIALQDLDAFTTPAVTISDLPAVFGLADALIEGGTIAARTIAELTERT